MGDLDVQVEIETPLGWLELEDRLGGYELHSESFSTQVVSWRKHEVASDWIEGTYTNHGVRNNVVEQLSVWVTGSTPFELHERLKAVTDCLQQLQYGMRTRFGDLQETMTCFPADYSVTTDQPMRFALHALIKAQVPRLPTSTVEQVVP